MSPPSPTWEGGPPPALPPARAGDRWRLVGRLLALGLCLATGLLVLGLVSAAERLCGRRDRRWSAHVPRLVSRAAVAILGIAYHVEGRPMTHPGAVVANHGSWLDILALNAAVNVFFVAKAEVAGWPGIGGLARAAGTVFIRRDRREAAQQAQLFEDRIRAGHRLLFFPEGTSTDTQRILPFKSTLFQAFFTEDLKERMWVQPVTLRYIAPEGEDPRFYGWWGDMPLGPHLRKVLVAKRGGRIVLDFHPALRVRDQANRKSLAAACEEAVRHGGLAL
ncbi:lysophospholipid acyltransferase family protein [Thioclava litoralis]|uniref:Lysophospholipid acyltransferase family protein n=1 Tax=Thioclava litoralis TaxID=3076557 RepID=A0ABZ1DX60_9RHOB|nr:lysophospholipid acyltransferase family protein [Thioclava sp. FTW29]